MPDSIRRGYNRGSPAGTTGANGHISSFASNAITTPAESNALTWGAYN